MEVHPVRDSSDLLAARTTLSRLMERAGCTPIERVQLLVVISELARNIIMHVGQGQISFDLLDDRSVWIEAADEGAGIADPENAFQPSHGLYAVRVAVDELTIEKGTNGRGTRIVARKRLHPAWDSPPRSA